MALRSVLTKSRVVSVVAAALGLAGASFATAPSAAAAEPWPSQVHAIYRIQFNGFDVGTFEFNAVVEGQSYTLTGDAKLSALLGAFHWKGDTRASGVLAAAMPRPAGYTFDYAGTGKKGSIKMGFAGDAVTSLTHVPPHHPSPATIPVKESQLKGVLDPLSAVMALSRGDAANPCGRRLSLFDGKQRFDLLLTYRRQERVAETKPSGQPGVAFVCRVKYMPIAGHKINEETRALAASNEIEVSLRPVPSANLFIPHIITIPTGAGPARLVAQHVRITTRSEQIALSH